MFETGSNNVVVTNSGTVRLIGREGPPGHMAFDPVLSILCTMPKLRFITAITSKVQCEFRLDLQNCMVRRLGVTPSPGDAFGEVTEGDFTGVLAERSAVGSAYCCVF